MFSSFKPIAVFDHDNLTFIIIVILSESCKDTEVAKKIDEYIACRNQALGPKADKLGELKKDQENCVRKTIDAVVNAADSSQDVADKIYKGCDLKLIGVDFNKC